MKLTEQIDDYIKYEINKGIKSQEKDNINNNINNYNQGNNTHINKEKLEINTENKSHIIHSNEENAVDDMSNNKSFKKIWKNTEFIIGDLEKKKRNII